MSRFKVIDLDYHPHACLYDSKTGKVLLYNREGIGLTLHDFSLELNILEMHTQPESKDRIHYLIELFCYCGDIAYDN